MEKRFKVIVSDKAKEMLASHLRFIAEYDMNAALKAKEQLIEALLSLSLMPKRFPFFNEEYVTQNKYRKMVAAKRYIVLYQIKEDTVYADYIIDCRSDYTWLLK